MKRARRWAIANRAGGVGKTTTTVNLAAALARRDRRVLIIDLDAQHNATTAIGLRDSQHEAFPESNVYEAFIDPDLTSQAIGPTSISGVDLVYGSPDMETLDLKLIMDADPNMAIKARQMIDTIEALDRYDVVIMDCPGAINVATRNALFAVDVVVMPVQTHFRSYEARGRLLTEISKLVEKKTLKNPPRVVAFANMLDERSRSARELRDMILEDVAGNAAVADQLRVFPLSQQVDGVERLIAIHASVQISDAYAFNQSIFDYAPNTRATAEYIALTDALEQLELTEAQPARG